MIRLTAEAEKRKALEIHQEQAPDETKKLPTQPSFGKLLEHPRKSRADKGKEKVDETRSTIPLAAKTQNIPRIMENFEETRPLKKKRIED